MDWEVQRISVDPAVVAQGTEGDAGEELKIQRATMVGLLRQHASSDGVMCARWNNARLHTDKSVGCRVRSKTPPPLPSLELKSSLRGCEKRSLPSWTECCNSSQQLI